MSRQWRLQAIGLLLLVLSGGRATADLRYIANTTPDGVRFVMVSGVFDPDDDLQDFYRIVTTNHPVAVVFDSPGGQPEKAMELGRLIRELGLATFQPHGPECLSA